MLAWRLRLEGAARPGRGGLNVEHPGYVENPVAYIGTEISPWARFTPLLRPRVRMGEVSEGCDG